MSRLIQPDEYFASYKPIGIGRFGEGCCPVPIVIQPRYPDSEVVRVAVTQDRQPRSYIYLILFQIKSVDAHDRSPKARYDTAREDNREWPGNAS